MVRSHVSVRGIVLGLAVAVLVSGGTAPADVFNMGPGLKSLEFVAVGDPGNLPDTRVMYGDGTSGYGAVPYAYRMSKFEITVAQYAEFLNAVAASDPYGLFNANMANPALIGCGIARSGTAGNYTYTVTKNPDFPVNYVSWGDAARFCNWLANGQPSGAQGPGTTETGSYMLNGGTSEAALLAITRSPGATYIIPTEDEWYKAAYYKGGGPNAGYWLFPTQSDAIPSNILSSTGTNNANYFDDGYTDPTNYLTPVGYFAGSPGPYGTFDMGGNVAEWNEAVIPRPPPTGTYYRGLRGGSFSSASLRADLRGASNAAYGDEWYGFRVALVPDPATIGLLTLGLVAVLRSRAGLRSAQA
jgi:sulfatase modifying factor 1